MTMTMKTSRKPEPRNLLVFDIGQYRFAVPMDAVSEVIPKVVITPVPRTASFVRGLASVRGSVMTVIHGAERLGIPAVELPYFAVMKVRGTDTAIMIESPVEAREVQVERVIAPDMQALIPSSSVNPALFTAAWKIIPDAETDPGEHEDIIVFELNPDQFVSDQMASQLKVG